MITAARVHGDVEISGLLDRPAVVALLIALCRDGDVRDRVAEAADALTVLEGDPDHEDELVAKAALDDASRGLEFVLRRKSLRLAPEDAVALRQALTARRSA
jgi:hypothetical protein